MSKRDPREHPCWFFVKIGDDPMFGNLIVWAGCKTEVYEKFQNNVKVVKVSPLSWRGLKELTGCSIPINCEPDEIARQEIMYQYNKRAISILPNVSVDVVGV